MAIEAFRQGAQTVGVRRRRTSLDRRTVRVKQTESRRLRIQA
jgi:hypothetical protein